MINFKIQFLKLTKFSNFTDYFHIYVCIMYNLHCTLYKIHIIRFKNNK